MHVGVVQNTSTLARILELQRVNLPGSLSVEERCEQGFVTVEHSVEALSRLHALLPSVVATEGDDLVGYALSMAIECRAAVPILEPMFEVLMGLRIDGVPLADQRFYVMGQVCVAKSARGQGVFDALYAAHRSAYSSRFDWLVTEISTRNRRSLKAHQRVGFREIHRFEDATDAWVVVAWDWRNPVAVGTGPR